VVRGQEEENVEETQVTCGKTARKRATSAAAVGAAQIKTDYVPFGPDGENVRGIQTSC